MAESGETSILSSEQHSDERLSDGPLTVLRLSENLIERLRAYWPIEGITDGQVAPSESAFEGIFEIRKALQAVLKETDLPEFLDVAGFSAEIRKALGELRQSFVVIESRIVDPPHRGTLLPAATLAAIVDTAGRLRRRLERDKRVRPIPRLPRRVQAVGPGVWKRRPNYAEFVQVPAQELAAFELAARSRNETLVDDEQREMEVRLRALSLKPSADDLRQLQREAAELSAALNDFSRSAAGLSLKLSNREALKPVLSACLRLGLTLCWRGRASFKHHAGTSMKSQEDAVQERIEYLDEEADPNDFPGWPEPQKMAGVLDKIAQALKLTVTKLHCQDICIGRSIRWLVVDVPKDFPFDAARAKYRHAFGWTADAVRAIAAPNDSDGWIEILVDDDLFLWPDLTTASQDLSLAARMLDAHLRRLAKSDLVN